MLDKEGDSYFHVSDLRGNGNTFNVTQTWSSLADETGGVVVRNEYHGLLFTANSSNYTVTIKDSSGNDITSTYEIEKDTTGWTSRDGLGPGETATAEYVTESSAAKAYTFGIRESGSVVGPMSFAEGYDTTSSGYCSHAQNVGTKAISYAQTAIGQYNVVDQYGRYALIIGRGWSDSNRRNALAVRWDGTIESAKKQFVIRSVTVNSVAATSYKTITAPTVSGYEFVCWIGSASSGSVHPTYINNPDAGVASVWNASSVVCNIQCWALYTWA